MHSALAGTEEGKSDGTSALFTRWEWRCVCVCVCASGTKKHYPSLYIDPSALFVRRMRIMYEYTCVCVMVCGAGEAVILPIIAIFIAGVVVNGVIALVHLCIRSIIFFAVLFFIEMFKFFVSVCLRFRSSREARRRW